MKNKFKVGARGSLLSIAQTKQALGLFEKEFPLSKYEIAVIETGLGGRLDATNALTNVIASVITKTSRSVDIPARYGGEEFVVILPETDKKDACVIAERIRKNIAAIEVKINDDLSLDRNNVKYISQGKTKQLTREETYQYFCEDTWTPFSVPTKYWDKSWKGS